MKNKILILLSLLVLLPINTLASNDLDDGYWEAPNGYNYDVDTLKIDDNGKITLGGWAVLDASPKTNSGSPNTKLMSGVKDSDYNENRIDGSSDPNKLPKICYNKNTYTFTLYVYKAKSNGEKGNLINTYKSKDASYVSMTYNLSHKYGDTIRVNVDRDMNYACYENVGFKFTIDPSTLSGNSKLIFELHVKTASGIEKYFDLTVITVEGQLGSSINVDAITTETRVTKVTNLMQNGYTWDYTLDNSSKSSDYKVNNGDILEVSATKTSGNMTWYEVIVNKKKRWVPSSWVLPSGSASIIVTSPVEADTCTSSATIPSKTTDTINTCDGTKSREMKDSSVCKSETKFYEVTCTETVTTNFKSDIPSKMYAGQGFKLNAEVKSVRTCEGTFYEEDFKKNWEIAVNNYNNTKAGSPERYEAENIKNTLIDLVKAYNTFTNNNYTFDPTINGSLKYKVKDNTKKNKYRTETSTIEFDRTIDEGSGKYTKKGDLVKLNINGLTNPYKTFVYSNTSDPKVAKFIIKHTYLTPITGEMSGTGVDGFNYFYTDYNMMAGSYNINLTLSNLGNYKTYTVEDNGCSINIEDTNLIYRHISLSDPFITSASNYTHKIGYNWSNSTKDFTKVASQTGTSLYVFNLSSEDLKEIKKYSSTQSTNLYLGGCTDTINGADTDPVCEILQKGKK